MIKSIEKLQPVERVRHGIELVGEGLQLTTDRVVSHATNRILAKTILESDGPHSRSFSRKGFFGNRVRTAPENCDQVGYASIEELPSGEQEDTPFRVAKISWPTMALKEDMVNIHILYNTDEPSVFAVDAIKGSQFISREGAYVVGGQSDMSIYEMYSATKMIARVFKLPIVDQVTAEI